MSIHLEAQVGDIAPVALMPGDPLRAKYIAETFLENAVCYNQVRGMLGYTGTYKGHKVSIQGSGMGIPSFSIYATELIKDYGCKTIIRIGTCGAIQEDVKLRDVLLAQAVCTDSSINKHYFPDAEFARLRPSICFGAPMTSDRKKGFISGSGTSSLPIISMPTT